MCARVLMALLAVPALVSRFIERTVLIQVVLIHKVPNLAAGTCRSK